MTGLLLLGLGLAAPAGSGDAGEDGSPTPHRFRSEQVQMGSPFVLTCYAQDESTATAAFAAASRRVKALTMILSDYHDRSELNRLCDTYTPGEPVRVSPDLARVLAAARGFSEASGGAFDVTVAPLSKLWRRVRRRKALPGEPELAAARAAVGWAAVTVDEAAGTVTITRPGVRLDLGGIAKGYAADAALAVMRDHGCGRCLIDAGGDLLAGEPPPGEPGWTVALPDGNTTLPLANAALATSGDAYKFVTIDGTRYSHILDPRTGRPLTESSTITVLAPTGMTADALASTVSVLGAEDGSRLLEKRCGVEGRVETAAGVVVTPGWPATPPAGAAPRSAGPR